MAIAAADLIALCSLNRPENDTTTSGGGIDVDNRPEFTQMGANDTLEMLSSAAGDTTQTVTVTGRNSAGAVVIDTKTLNGTTVVAFTGTFERVQKVLMSADAVGTITVRRASAGPTVGTIPIGERGFTMAFINSASESGIAIRYEKIFWKNTHATLTLNSAETKLTADPDARIRVGVSATKNDTLSVANRKTAPGGITFVDDNVAQAVAGNTLEALAATGLWIEQNLPASDTPKKSSFTTQLSGTSV